ncbi:PrsW family intramembrane metalloprotease [Dermabacter vaginalis]|uniref:PrsW family intramembrane metalloprotease n=1 Tax=Dermabacter vaginalis TaxID=1630135 RepID=UPI001EF437EB|nr:PrsW family intramembrane metalloprotease [Dermabacter vaginalis]MCG7444186.1 PrsW family intramembrane metalloprotease [Dermabacter vaginalis]
MSTTGKTLGYGYDVEREIPADLAHVMPSFAEREQQKKKRGKFATWVIFTLAFAVLAFAAVALFLIVIVPLGIGTSLVSLTAALVPFGIVLFAVWWLDRTTPQPRFTMAYAFLWGAIGSIALTYIFGTAVVIIIALQTQDATSQEFLSVAFQAPVVEETTKAFGLVLLLLFGRRYISGTIDGVIYAVLIAAGFAFTENITYFARSFAEAQVMGNSTVFWQTFFMRGLLSPFAHASFTSLVGLGIGIAAQRRSLPLYFFLGAGGLGLGMGLHALWNGGSMLLALNGVTSLKGLLFWYAVIEVPIFLTFVLVMVFLRWREKRMLRRRLSEYGRAGWFTPSEVDMLVSLRGRRRAKAWASSFGAVATWTMAEFQNLALRLAAQRQAAVAGHTSSRIKESEALLLSQLTETRRVIAALTTPVVPARTMIQR